MDTPKKAESCEGCRYAQPVVTKTENIILECYRYPGIMVVIDNELYQVHPDADYRCGEYRKTKEEELTAISGFLQSLKNRNAIKE